MADQSAQRDVLPLAPRAVVDAFFVRGAGEVLVQAGELVETAVAEVAAVEGAVPGGGAGHVRGAVAGGVVVVVVVVVPADALVGEDVVGVDLAAVEVDFGAGDARGAAAGFEVEADAGEVGEFVGAPGAFDVLSHVGR